RELAQIKGIRLIVGNSEKFTLIEQLGDLQHSNSRILTNDNRSIFTTRGFIRVQDGCSNFCSYCIVPLVRGAEKSVPVATVLNEVRQRVNDGYQEVVLTGTEIGSYSYDNLKLMGLLERILAETEVRRLRLSSLQPQEISPELIALWHNKRLCRHFHLSLQSGSDEVLGRMNRRYSLQDYQKSVDLIREAIPEVAITTDIIVGFPGETEAEFVQSYEFCKKMRFARIHVFSYSARQGTRAAEMPDQVDDRVKKARSRKMLDLAKTSAKDFCQRFLGSTATVLFEQQSNGVWSGLTDNYIKVYARSSQDLTNRLTPVKIIRIRQDGVWGEVEIPVNAGPIV
ncbi:MiaB/RimO family radical SAM methylthiotransferase, partial [Chloroflexota bacterium]